MERESGKSELGGRDGGEGGSRTCVENGRSGEEERERERTVDHTCLTPFYLSPHRTPFDHSLYLYILSSSPDLHFLLLSRHIP